MKEQRQNLYEGMYVISATLSDDARTKALEKIRTGITQRGGEILKTHDKVVVAWHMRLMDTVKDIIISFILI